MPFAVSALAGAAFWGTAAVGVYSADKASDTAKGNRKAALNAAELEYQMGQDTLAYYRERDAQSAALQGQANAIAGRVANAQVGLMNQQAKISGEYHTRNKTVFWPLEDQMVKDAQAYDTKGRRESEASRAIADVGLQGAMEQQALNRSRQRMGVNPASGNMDAMSNQLSLASASSKAAAGNNARDRVEQQGWSRRMDAASLGRGLASAQAAAAGTASQAGSNAVGAAYAPVNAFNASTALMGQGLASGASMLRGANNTAMSANTSPSNNSGQLFNLAGQIAGQYFAGQGGGTNQTSNLAYANGVSSAGGDGLGAFISANGW